MFVHHRFSFSTVVVVFIVALSAIHGISIAQSQEFIASKLHENYRGKGCVTASFAIKYFDAIREKEERYAGTFILCGDRYKITTKSTVYVCNANTLTTHNLKSNQVTIEDATGAHAAFKPSALFNQYISRISYKKTASRGDNVYYEAILDSITAQLHINTCILTINTPTRAISEIAITDDRTNRTTYTFSETLFKASLPEGTFTFVPPRNATITDKTK